ncbi:MAG: trypsin-like peptidase domain-containing protein [Desulfovibrio sp.]|jgi:TPR repeat protein|nr:trypsin-like peptidase domain-containing protein [Desulfovibrio sp.]
MRLSVLLAVFSAFAVSVSPALAGSVLDTFLECRENERREEAAASEARTLFVRAQGRESVTRGSGLFLGNGRILTLASVVGDDAEAALLIAGDHLPPTPARIEAREEKEGGRSASDFVLLRLIAPPHDAGPVDIGEIASRRQTPKRASQKQIALVFSGASRPGGRVAAWGCTGTPSEKTINTPEGTAYMYSFPPPLRSEGLVLSTEPGEALRHAALPAAGAAGGPLAAQGGSIVGLNLGAQEADDQGALSASARPASEIVAFLRACGVDALLASPPGQEQMTASPPENAEANEDTAAALALMLSPDAMREDRDKGAAMLRARISRRNADPESLALFAWALRAGFFADVDEREAVAAAEKAAKAGNPQGKAVLGFLYYDALLLEADPRKARALAEEAAAEGENMGKALLALLDYEDKTADIGDVLRRAEEAAAAGDASAMGLAACIYALSEDFINYRAAEKQARAAAERGDVLGLYILALLYRDGTLTERDPARAWACATLSLDRERGPHLKERKALLGHLDEQLTDQEKEQGKRILRALLLNRLPG